MVFPTRFVNVDAARREFGEAADRLAAALSRTDPAAEAVVAAFGRLAPGRGKEMLDQALAHGIETVEDAPDALVELFERLDRVPPWVDWDAMQRGAAMYLRHGPLGAGVIGCFSAPIMYSSPAGNKPLIFSSRLVQKAPRRMTETAHFVLETSRPGGLRRFADGFRITVKVRLMHAQVRRLLARSERWKWEQWGAPLNQADLAGTNLALSALIVEGLERLGFHITAEERDGFVQLWRYVGYLLGIEAELLCATYAEAARMQRLIDLTQQGPDDDARALIDALRNATLPPPLHIINKARGPYAAVCRYMLGDQRADALGYPRTAWRHAIPLLRAGVWALDSARRLTPGADAALVRACTRMYEKAIHTGLEGQRPEYAMPEALRKSVVARRTVVQGSLRALEGA